MKTQRVLHVLNIVYTAIPSRNPWTSAPDVMMATHLIFVTLCVCPASRIVINVTLPKHSVTSVKMVILKIYWIRPFPGVKSAKVRAIIVKTKINV